MRESSSHNVIYGKHPVEEALRTIPGSIERIVAFASRRDNSLIKSVALRSGVTFEELATKEAFEGEIRKFVDHSVNHQHVFAIVEPYRYISLDEALRDASPAPRVLILDHITDVSNFGAIVRSSVAFGVDFIIIAKDRSVGAVSACYRTSTGALLHSRIVRVGNIAAAVKKLKANGYWIFAASGSAEKEIKRIDFSGRSAIVLGSEDRGVSPGVLKVVDDSFRIPISSAVDSLNVSVAAGICLYHMSASRRKTPS